MNFQVQVDLQEKSKQQTNGNIRGILEENFNCAMLGSEMIGNLNINTKMFDFDERVLIGWLANAMREPANQDACQRRVPQSSTFLF